MEDVLLSYLKSRRSEQKGAAGESNGNGSSSASGSASIGSAFAQKTSTEPASWTHPPESGDAFVKPSLPYPLCTLFTLVDSHREYPDSCRELAEFLKKLSGQFPLEEVMTQVFQARFPRVWMERFLFILLEVQTSDWQTAAYVLQFRHLKRLLLRVERQKRLNSCETTLAREIIQALNLSRFTDLDAYCRHAANTFKAIQGGNVAVSQDLGLLIYLIRCEVAAMGERKNWLEGDLTTGEPDSIARLTPHLKLLEDRMHNAQEMAQRLGGYGPVADAPMGLEVAMGPFFFAHFRESLAKVPALALFKQTLDLQRSKRVPTRDLIALSTLSRWLLEARGTHSGPLEWVHTALDAYDRGHFRIDVAGGLPAVEVLLGEAKVEREDTLILGNFGENPYSSWIARDGLTRPFRSSNPDRLPPDMRTIVLSNLHRENIILKLLDCAKVFQTPGLVEAIVETNRSPLVHAKIATRAELHSGPVNGRVPVMLLKSPVTIPTALLRALIHPSRIPIAEMKSLYRSYKSSLRREVVEELHSCLKQAYAL